MRVIAILSVLCSLLLGCDTGGGGPGVLATGRAPDFTLTLTTGEKVTKRDFAGRPLVLVFMAEWCPCSNESAPVFKEAYERYHPRGVEFLLIGFQDSRSKFRRFVERERFPFPAGYDEGDAIGASYGVNAPPTTFFIGPDGAIRNAYYGKIDDINVLVTWIEQLLDEPPAGAGGTGGA